jgi:hypothetical protein
MPPAYHLARRYGQALAALRAIHAFDAWLGEQWQDRCPPPGVPPVAHTALGAGGEIAWYEVAESVLGYLPGHDGCFRIARDAALPDFPLLDDSLPIPPGTDVVISASMQEEL